ncbi:MAG: cobalamin-dependent protein [Chloroflexota bacterium]
MNPLSGSARAASAELRARSAELSEEIVARQYAMQPELWKPYGERGRQISVRDMGYHISYLADSTLVQEPRLFMDYIAWVKVLFHHIGLPREGLGATLECTREVISERLPQELTSVISPQLDAAIVYLPDAPETVGSFLDKDLPYGDLAGRYISALLAGTQREATRLVEDEISDGATVADMYMHVFQPCQWEIGRLWQTAQISVADEHYCTAATQMIMSQLYRYVFNAERNGLTIVSTCVGDEMHELGARMVADVFEMNGWQTTYLGANVPTRDIIRTVEKQSADVLAVSATLVSHIDELNNLIAQVRDSSKGGEVKILVGGYPFRVAPGLHERMGADGSGLDAQDAVETARIIMKAG